MTTKKNYDLAIPAQGWTVSSSCPSNNIMYVTANVPDDAVFFCNYVANCQQALSGSNANWYGSLGGAYAGGQSASVTYNSIAWPWERVLETPEEKVKRETRALQRKAAEQRAEKLLFSILTPTQVKQYTDDNYFDCPVGERIYRLRKGRSMNVELIEAGRAKIKFCAHPDDQLIPVPDVLLSQLLMLQANEQGFLQIANRTVLQ